MLLSKFKAFTQEISLDKSISNMVVTISFYRKWDDNWYDNIDSIVDSEEIQQLLNKTIKTGSEWRPVNSKIAYFPVKSLTSVIAIEFGTVTTKKTRKDIQRKINTCLDRANKDFDSSHDQLTGLLNGSAFSKRVQELLDQALPLPEQDYGGISPTNNNSLSIFAIDIDHFKQVNDTHGHVYGDSVLKILGKRLYLAADKIRETEHDKINNIFVSRPSGEEFLILVSGAYDIEGFKTIGEYFRGEITKGPLPSDEEWGKEYPPEKNETSIRLPSLSDRKITISVGIATVASGKDLNKSDSVKMIRDRADKALYCAKAGGRNTVRHFDEILDKFGRIIEHHEKVEVVIIDIGKEVNVQKGQEFTVFHPQFSGGVPYIFDDGRTKRSLGKCPRIPIGRIIAFDVEPEISFCKVEDNKSSGRFEPGSSLEAIPLGSISHLLSQEQFFSYDNFQLSSPSQVSAECKKASDAGKQTMAVVFTLANETTLYKERGSAFINKCLADLYQEIQKQFPANVFIQKVSDTEFGVLRISNDNDNMKETSTSVLNESRRKTKELADFRMGLYLGEKSFDLEGDQSELSWEWAIDYAYFATARVKQIQKTKFVTFNPETMNNLLYVYYESKQFSKALRDYHELRERGVSYYLLENKASLCSWSMPDRNNELLIESSDRAIELNPKDVVMWANSGFFNYYLGNISDAYTKYNMVLTTNPDYIFGKPYLVSAADAFLTAFSGGNCAQDIVFVRTLVERATPVSLSEKRINLYVKFTRALENELKV